MKHDADDVTADVRISGTLGMSTFGPCFVEDVPFDMPALGESVIVHTPRGPVRIDRSKHGVCATLVKTPPPLIGDASDKPIALAAGKLIQGWSVTRWIEAIHANPDRTLPGGVGGAIVAHFEHREPDPDFDAAVAWHRGAVTSGSTKAASYQHVEAILRHFGYHAAAEK